MGPLPPPEVFVTRILLLLAVLGALLPHVAESQQPYIEPALRNLMRPEMMQALVAQPGQPPLADRERGFVGGLDIELAPLGAAPRVGLFLSLRNPQGIEDIRAAGGEVIVRVGDVVGAYVPAERLPLLAASTRIERIEASRIATVRHDSSIVAMRAHLVRQRTSGGWSGATGQGVVVGVYDTGIDLRHGDFRHPDGRSRVLSVWDQTAQGSPPPGYTLGHLCTAAQIQALECQQVDRHGHGTHVAGSAAGNGAEAGADGVAFQFAGVAPEADLIVVKGSDGGSFSFLNITAGVQWIFAEAERLGRPAVVNLSLGSQSGPRDGTTLFERSLDQLSGPGRVIVAAAGNEGSNITHPAFRPQLFHAMGRPDPRVTRRFQVRVPSYTPTANACNDWFSLTVWAPGETRLTMRVQRPDGSAAVAAFGESVVREHPQGRVVIENATSGPNPANGDYESFIQVDDCGGSGPPQQGAWIVEIEQGASATSGRRYHMWLSSAVGQSAALGETGFDNLYIPGNPSSADRIIAVGAFTTRTQWPSVTGNRQLQDREETGDIAYFSSPGPRRDEVLKPDVAAPGRVIMSALSQHASSPDALVAPSRAHNISQGTSMASPHVAGAVAILLQTEPTLTPEQVRSVVTSTAIRDEFTHRVYPLGPRTSGSVPNAFWGYGKVDLRAAVDALGAPRTEPASLRIVPRGDTLPPGGVVQLNAAVLTALGDRLVRTVTWTSRDPSVATVGSQGLVTALGEGATWIIASSAELTDSVLIRVVAPATLVIRARAVPAPTDLPSGQGAALTLLSLRASVQGTEPMEVLQLGFRVSGNDPQARILLARTTSADGGYRAGDVVLADTVVALRPGQPVEVRFRPSLQVAPGDTLQLALAVQLSGAAPHGTVFEAVYLPGETRALGVLTRVQDRVDVGAPVTSEPFQITVLRADEVFNLTQNPIRTAPVIMSFRERPRVAAIYTLGGRRVVDLTGRLDASGHRLEWDLTNDAGARVAPGVYLAVFQVGDTTIRERLIVTRTR
jgi:subtilisin family serine protease